jgi:hypothetical protein
LLVVQTSPLDADVRIDAIAVRRLAEANVCTGQ